VTTLRGVIDALERFRRGLVGREHTLEVCLIERPDAIASERDQRARRDQDMDQRTSCRRSAFSNRSA
jgi:hypothetical protein